MFIAGICSSDAVPYCSVEAGRFTLPVMYRSAVDRAGPIHARRIAKAIVMTAAAKEALVRLAWFPGDAAARIVSIDGSGGETLDICPWTALFDLSLEASGEHWTGATDLVDVARFGHFTDQRLPWETLRFASITRRAAA